MDVPGSANMGMDDESSDSQKSTRMPVYFLGIGGPNFMENTNHPAYQKLQAVGKEITTQVKPKAVVVFSAHWQAGPDRIEINVAENAPLIYDFYGFPPHYYQYEYPSKGSPDIAKKVTDNLDRAGIEVDRVKRGLDHGVWVGFLAAFNPKSNPLNVPLVQVSLYNSEDPDKHYRLGKALESLRDEGILIIGAGMAVHNLYDFRATRGMGKPMPYTSTFEDKLKDAATGNPSERREKMATLMQSSEARRAHPTAEHIHPMFVVAGAAGSDVGARLWTYPEASLNWAQYRFGEIPA